MTRNETAKILAMLNAYYPAVQVNPEMAVNAWHMILKGYPYEVVEQAVITFAASDNRDYPKFPSVGQIRTQIDKMCRTGDSPEELWNKVYHAIQGNTDRAREAFDALPCCCQIWLHTPNQLVELGLTDKKTVNTVVRGQFLKTITQIQEREKIQAMLPEELKQKLDGRKIDDFSVKKLQDDIDGRQNDNNAFVSV